MYAAKLNFRMQTYFCSLSRRTSRRGNLSCDGSGVCQVVFEADGDDNEDKMLLLQRQLYN